MTVRSIDRGYAALLKRAKMAKVAIATGVLAKQGEQPKRAGKGEHAEALTLIQVAVWNHFGTSDGRIPPRPFITDWFDAEEPHLRKMLADLLREVIAGKLSNQQALDRMGLYCVGQIQKCIAEGIAPANAESTVRRKGSSTPLVDTGQLRSSITYEVRKGGGGSE